MAIIKLAGFTGEMPRVTPRLLPATGAQTAQDVRLEDGELSPFRKPFEVAQLAGAVAGEVKTLYRHGVEWLHWDSVVHACPGPVAQDRLYYTGDGAPKMRVSGAIYDLALPMAAGALTAAVTSGTVTALYATRLYVYTWVTDFGEESEPCPVSNALNVTAGNTVTLSGFENAPTGRNITKQRIYRSQTGTAGGTQFYFLAERDASNANYVDTIALDQFSEPLPSLDWNTPPADMHGLVSLPNGMMAAISGKHLCFCEPYRPHAWPEKYRLALDYDGVALGAYGTTIVVGTAGNPYLVGGTHPDTMVSEKMELNMPCLSKQGMVDLGYAVAYPSNDGLVLVQGGAATLPSSQLFTRDQWLMLDPADLVCGQFYGRFFGSYDYLDQLGENQKGTIIMDLTGEQPYLIRSRHKADAFFYEVASNALFMVMGTSVYEFDSRLALNDTFTWRSKTFMLPAPTNFGAILIEADQRQNLDAIIAFETALDAAIASNQANFAAASLHGALNDMALNTFPVNGDTLVPVPTGPQATVNVFADGVLIASLTRIGRMLRLPGGMLAREWMIEVSGNTPLQEVTLAGTAQELRSV